MRLALSLTIALLPLLAVASGWDTNVWGVAGTNGITGGTTNIRYYLDASTNKIFVKDQMLLQAQLAVNERATAISVAGVSTTGWFRLSRSRLVSIKSWVTNNAVKFVRTNDYATSFVSSSTATHNYAWQACDRGTGFTNSVNEDSVNHSFPATSFYSVSTLTNDLSLPSDYFSSTPWRKLSDTNTANGWHSIDDILNVLDHVEPSLSWSARGETNSIVGADTIGLSTNSWATYKLDAESNATKSVVNGFPYENSFGINFKSGAQCPFSVKFQNRYAYPVVVLASSPNANVTYYLWVDEVRAGPLGTFIAREDHNVGTSFYNGHGSVSATAGLWTGHTDVAISGTFTSATEIGSMTAVTNSVNWCIEPVNTTNSPVGSMLDGSSGVQDSRYTSLGWTTLKSKALADYKTPTNGFVYSSR